MNTKPIKGLRSYYPTDKGPIDTYQLGHDGRIEFLAAEIGTDHLSKGVNTTDEWKKWAQDRGTASDEPGLIISKRLGGSGIDSVNLFPKSKSLDETSSWTKDEETAYNESIDMKKWKKIKFFAKFEYPEDDSLRPSQIEYQYELPSGTVLHSKVSNEKADGEAAKEEEEESEYEYEYEEEEEEEEAAAPEVKEPEKVEESVQEPPPVIKPIVEEKSKQPEVVSKPPPEVVPEFTFKPVVPPPSTSPPTSYTYKPPPPPAPEPYKREEYTQPKAETSPPSPQKQKSPTPVAEKGANSKLLTQSDFIEMIPIIGSLKLVVDVLKALSSKNTKLAFWKAFQCGISVLGDFYFMRAFARHGRILVKPITEEKVIGFVNKAEAQIIIFGSCTVGNQVLSSLRRILS